MANKYRSRSAVDPAIDELEKVRFQLDEALTWLRDGHTTAEVVALAQGVRQLCEQALLADNTLAVEMLLRDVKAKLTELEILLRRH